MFFCKKKKQALLKIAPVQDEQVCNIKLGSWTHDGDIISPTLYNKKEQMDLSDFANSSSPYVVTRHMEGTRNMKYYSCCDEPYIDLNFK